MQCAHFLNKLGGDIDRSLLTILSQVLRSRVCNFIHNDCWELSCPKYNEHHDSIISCAPTRLQEERKKNHKCWIRWWSYSPRRVRQKGTYLFWCTSRRDTRHKITNWCLHRSKLVDFRGWLLKNIEVRIRFPVFFAKCRKFFLPCNLAHKPISHFSAKNVWRGQTVVWQLAS